MGVVIITAVRVHMFGSNGNFNPCALNASCFVWGVGFGNLVLGLDSPYHICVHGSMHVLIRRCLGDRQRVQGSWLWLCIWVYG